MSYRTDIEAGFQVLHIDPSVDMFGKPDIDEIHERIFELYDHCWSYAQRVGHDYCLKSAQRSRVEARTGWMNWITLFPLFKSFVKKTTPPAVVRCNTEWDACNGDSEYRLLRFTCSCG
jgi:hypothetical protein